MSTTFKSEREKIVDFVIGLRRHAKSERAWKFRLAQFGFAIDATDEGPAIVKLPAMNMVCVLPEAASA